MRTVAVLSLVCLLALAGCGGTQGPDAPSTVTLTASPEPGGGQFGDYPPGVDATGVTNASALLAAHRASLVEDGFVVETAETRRATRGASNVSVVRRVAAAPNLSAHSVLERRVIGDDRQVVAERWTNGTVGVRRVRTSEGRVGHARYAGANGSDLAGSARLRWLLHNADFDLAADTISDGGIRYVLSTDGPGGTGREVNGISVRLVVTADGRIESLVASVAAGRRWDGGVRVETYEYYVVRTGDVGVDRPQWVDGALEAVGE